MSKIYTLWLPIENFNQLKKNILLAELKKTTNFKHTKSVKDIPYQYDKFCKKSIKFEFNSNTNWEWITFNDDNLKIIIDSLGFFYITTDNDKINIDEIAQKILTYIDKTTKDLIDHTFIYYRLLDKKKEENDVERGGFIKSIIIEFDNDAKIEIKAIKTSIKNGTNCNSDKFYNKSYIKISSKETNFENMLNRNFQHLLEKSLYYTNGCNFEDGEKYDNLDIIINNNIGFKIGIEVNNEDKTDQTDKITKQVLQKAIQDTIEEKTIQHFLKVTQENNLNEIFTKMSSVYKTIVKNNMKLLADFDDITSNSDDTENNDLDEDNVDSFIQALLRSIPQFYRIDAHIREAYYMKIGNTTNSAQVSESETLKSTYQYKVWMHYIDNFIETANKARDSLRLYHENRTLKELEDIGYNENYQADLEDIRDLKQKNTILDENDKNYMSLIVAIIAAITLSATMPIVDINFVLENFSTNNLLNYLFIQFSETSTTLIISLIGYSILLGIIYIIAIIVHKLPMLKNLFKSKFHIYEDNDYDKHEHRSNKALYNDNGTETKSTVEYDDTRSAIILLNDLKSKELRRGNKRFNIFPKLLTILPKNREYIFRENYRISRYDKVSTKLMMRYKIKDLKLLKLIDFIEDDSFKKYYLQIIGETDTDKKILDILKPKDNNYIDDWKDTTLNLYIVYAFSLKLNKREDKNKYIYTIYKDQMRVHFHINKLPYSTEDKKSEEINEQEMIIGELIYIYFLARMKRFYND